MSLGIYRVPVPRNEPFRDYVPGSPERESLRKEVADMDSERVEVPLPIRGKEIRTGRIAGAVMPHDHGHVLAGIVLGSLDLAGIRFTGSTGVFIGTWRTVGQNLEKYRSYPRLVDETSSKYVPFVHPSASPRSRR